MAREFKYAILGKNLQEETVVPQMTHRRKTLAPLLFILALLLILLAVMLRNLPQEPEQTLPPETTAAAT